MCKMVTDQPIADERCAVMFFKFADGLIIRVTDFWPEPYEPPPGRKYLSSTGFRPA